VTDIDATAVRHGQGTLPAVTLRGEPTRGEAGPESAPASGPTTGSRDVSAGTDGDAEVGRNASLTDLEQAVYNARELQDDQRAEVGRLLADARAGMTEATYRRALVLARDSVLLSIEECINGALAMEWAPLPRPEFSLAAIEAAVAEQERRGDDVI
jgi:hypothetical protein